ncbi:MAG: hypothetical protein RSC07_03710, partial [Mucinivorans sp.]
MLISLIKSLTKSQKRNFKLYANRAGRAADAKFVALFDVLESAGEWDEERILKRCPTIKADQLPNMKAHLYRQILVSLSLLGSSHNVAIGVREMISFARILYDKSLYAQCLKMLEKAKSQSIIIQNYTLTLEIVEFEKRVETIHMTRSTSDRAQELSHESELLLTKIANVNRLSNLSIQLYNLNLKLGYMRSEKDEVLIITYFRERIRSFDATSMDFHEKLYLYQSRMWYSYIQHDFLHCYRWARSWVSLFDERDDFKIMYYDHYIRGCSRLLDVLFMTRQVEQLRHYIHTTEQIRQLYNEHNINAKIMLELSILYGKINLHFLEGSFAQGISLAMVVDDFITRSGDFLDEHYRMQLNYKVACLYFGNDDYANCITYLQKVISSRNPMFRRDLQCFARILNL